MNLSKKQNNLVQLFLNFSKLMLCSTSLLLLLSFLSVTLLPTTVLLSLIFLSLFSVVIIRRKRLLQVFYKELQLNKFAMFILATALVYVFYFLLFKYGNPFQFKPEQDIERLKSFQVIDKDTPSLSYSFTAPINHLGAFELYFRPYLAQEVLKQPILETEFLEEEEIEPITEPNLDHLTAEIIFEEFLVEVYADGELIHSHVYGIPAYDQRHAYPIGFETDVHSKDREYQIVITRVSEFKPMQEVAVKNRQLLANPEFVIHRSQALRYLPDVIDFLVYKSAAIIQAELFYLLGFIVSLIVGLYAIDLKQKRKIVLCALATLTVYYCLFVIRRLGGTVPLMLREYSSLLSFALLGYVFYALRNKVIHKPILETSLKLKKSDFVMIFVVMMLFLGFGTHHLGQFMSVDEPKWVHTRVPQLYESIRTLDFASTYINDKPGVLPSYLAGIVYLFTSYQEYGPTTREVYLFYWRLPIIIFNALLIPLVYWLILKVFSRKMAALGIALIFLFPQLLGISQIVNPDATLWSSGLVATLFFMKYLKLGGSKDVHWSGIFLGLALLSKFFAALFYFSFFFLILFMFLTDNQKKEILFGHLWQLFKLALISMGVYGLLFPVTWVKPPQIIMGSIGAGIIKPAYLFVIPLIMVLLVDVVFNQSKLLDLVRKRDFLSKAMRVIEVTLVGLIGILLINMWLGYSTNDWFGEITEHTSGLIIAARSFINSVNTVAFGVPELVLVGTLLGLMGLNKKGRSDDDQRLLFFTISSWLFLIIGSTLIGRSAAFRYQIMLMPFFALLTVSVMAKLVANRKKFYIVVVAVYSYCILTLFIRAPFYLQYFNILNTQQITPIESWGFGGYELAQIINALPNAKELVVWSDREGFNEFFVGKSYWRGRDNPFDYEDEIDYLILTRSGDIRFNKAMLSETQHLYSIVGQKLVGERNLYQQTPDYEFCISTEDCYRAVSLK